MVSEIFYFLLFFIPLIVIPQFPSAFEIPKVILTEIGIGLLILFTINSRTFSLKYLPKNQVVLTLIIMILSIFHMFLNSESLIFFGNPFRLQGTILLWILLSLSLASSQLSLKHIPLFIPLLSFIALFFGTLLLGKNLSGRAVGTLGDPNALAASVVFIWPFLYYLFKSMLKKPIIWQLLLCILTTIIILLSGSRSGIIAFVIQLIFILLLYLKYSSLAKTLVLCIFLLITSYSLPFLEGDGWYADRAEIWQTSLVAGFQQPYIGHGFGNIEKVLPAVSKQLNNDVQYQYVDSSHNIFLDWWIQGGAVGLLSLFLLVGNTLYSFIRKENSRNIVLLLGLLTTLSFNPASIASLIAFWWLIGQGFTRNS